MILPLFLYKKDSRGTDDKPFTILNISVKSDVLPFFHGPQTKMTEPSFVCQTFQFREYATKPMLNMFT